MHRRTCLGFESSFIRFAAHRFLRGMAAACIVAMPVAAYSQESLEEIAGSRGDWKISSTYLRSFSEIAVLRKTAETRLGQRLAQAVPGAGYNQEKWECFIESYEVIEARNGVLSGEVRLLVPSIGPAASGLRPREVGEYCVAFINLAESGWYRLGSQAIGDSWDDARMHLAPEPDTDAVLYCSFDLPAPAQFEPGLDPSTAAFSMAIRGLPGLSFERRVRTLGILQSAQFEPGSTRMAITRLGRDLLSVVDALDPKERWMIYGLFVKSDMLSYFQLATDSLVEAGRVREFWESLPETVQGAFSRWIYKLNAEPLETRGLMESPSRAVQAAEAVHSESLRRALVKFSTPWPWAGVRQSAVVRFWDEGDDAMKNTLIDKLPHWAGMGSKGRLLNDRGEWVNRQELVDFWTAWLHS